jgi:hypothetical protein
VKWRNVAGLVFFLVTLFIVMARAGSLYATHFTRIQFTKECRAVDATHCRCDGVILTHSPEVTYSKEKPEPTKYQCTPETSEHKD